MSAHSTPVDLQVTLDSRIAVLQQLATDSALELPPGLDMSTWAEIGATLTRVEHSIQWWLGDWWRYGERAYGEAASAAAPTGYSGESCRNYARVAERIEPGRRSTALTFSHHQAVASLDPPDQDRLLRRAENEQMNVHHLRAVVRRTKDTNGNGHDPEPEHTHDYRCIDCGARLAD